MCTKKVRTSISMGHLGEKSEVMRDQNHPQRFTPPAVLGSLLKRAHDINTRLKLQRAREIAARDEAYLAMIRQPLPQVRHGPERGSCAHSPIVASTRQV